MELRKVRINGLDEFVRSSWFQQLPMHPVSSYRARSYQANPHARQDDPVLYFFESGGEIIAFRTVFPAVLSVGKERFAWLSGSWTHPLYRKKGLSTKLLKEIVVDWNGRLMATNFSPASRKLYLHSGVLHELNSGCGRRFYLQPDFKKLLRPGWEKLTFAGGLVNLVLAPLFRGRMNQYKEVPDNRVNWEKLAFPDNECMELANEQQAGFFFRRGAKELKWILAYPWLSTDDQTFEQSYPFSSYARQFEVYTVKFFRDGNFIGFLIYSLRDGHLKLLHQHFRIDFVSVVAQFMMGTAVNSRVGMVTVCQPELAREMQDARNPFLFSKEFRQSIFTSWADLPQNSLIQPAEGDFIFT
jgi:GNAT superfamily N-acetyltransferase